MTHTQTLVLFDPVGLLRDDTWISYLRSSVTGRNRPQLGKYVTWIPATIVFLWMATTAIMDVLRMNQNRSLHDDLFDAKNLALQSIVGSYDLGWEPIERPWERRAWGDTAGLIVRILLVIALFPFNTLSHHGMLFRFGRLKRFPPVRTAKLFGLLLLVVSAIFLILGAIARAVYPTYTASDIGN
jgi:uncharacterized membrane protein